MIRIEAMNHDGGFDLIKIFDEDAPAKFLTKPINDQINEFLIENENYFLRVVQCGKIRKILWQNFN